MVHDAVAGQDKHVVKMYEGPFSHDAGNLSILALCCSSRLLLAVQTMFGVMMFYLFRGNMGMAIVCMTSPVTGNYSSVDDRCDVTLHNDTPGQCENAAEFDYDKKTQGYILGSFFLLHFVTPVPLGWVAGKYGGKVVLGWSVLLCSIVSLLTPLAARTNFWLLLTSRVVMGLTQGGTWPAVQVLLSRWSPPLERTIISGLTVIGHCIGTLIGHPVSAVLCSYGFDSGWPSSFYVYGLLGVCWFIVWMLTVYESPITHKRISLDEMNYIVESLKATGNVNEKVDDIPWCRILRSLPVWSFIITIVCLDWGVFTFLFNIPGYLKEILQLDIIQSGMFAALPFVGYSFVTMISLYLPDWLRRNQYLRTTAVRKLFNSFGTFIPAVFLILTIHFGNSPTSSVILLSLGLTFSGCVAGGVALANTLDFAGRYCGVVMGIAIVFEALIGVFTELTVGYITVDNTQEQWHLIFYITSGIYVFGGVFFLVFGSGELQSWATIKSDIDINLSDNKDTKDKTFDKI